MTCLATSDCQCLQDLLPRVRWVVDGSEKGCDEHGLWIGKVNDLGIGKGIEELGTSKGIEELGISKGIVELTYVTSEVDGMWVSYTLRDRTYCSSWTWSHPDVD